MDAIYKSNIAAGITRTSADTDKPWSVSFNISTAGMVIRNEKVGDKIFSLKSSAAQPTWSENPSEIASANQSGGTVAACKIESTGAAVSGYFTVVTKPANCEFKLPTITVGLNAQKQGEIEIGTYWRSSWTSACPSNNCSIGGGAWDVAHNLLPLIEDASKMPHKKSNPAKVLTFDNGFILVEPGGKTYLLADAGVAQKKRSQHLAAERIAKDILASQFPGVAFAGLLKAIAGVATNDYADSTVFAKGSVIALYDDTPDMSGTVDVVALTSAIKKIDLVLEWSAHMDTK